MVIDPYLTGNPTAVSKPENIHAQVVLLTHAHSDHIADAVGIARRNNALVVAIHELATYMSWQGCNVLGMNIGGKASVGFADVRMVQAFHSSGIIVDDQKNIIYAGMPAGFLIHWDGMTILHAGDTCLFSDMKLIGERYNIDLAFLPIGDLFTMGPEDAVTAAEWLRAKRVVPIHYNTFPPIRQDASHFVKMLGERGIQGIALKPGESTTL
jgi:L-ascorbate metabolism protein UlaG (beta-lactamase superfamily)